MAAFEAKPLKWRCNFFDVGGHSLLSIRVITKVKKSTGVQLNQAIMVLQTLEQVAKECEGLLKAS